MEVEQEKPVPTATTAIGVDLGIKTLATLSDGKRKANPRALKQAQKRLRRLERQKSRRKLGSKNREKTCKKLAKQHARVANIRKDGAHNLTTNLCKNHALVAIAKTTHKWYNICIVELQLGSDTMTDTLVGQRFGKLVVLRELEERRKGKIFYECLCDCGQTKAICKASLIHELTKTCGCNQGGQGKFKRNTPDSLTGNKYGALTVLAYHRFDKKRGRHFWACICDCGKETIIEQYELTEGIKTSCGCKSHATQLSRQKTLEKYLGKRFGMLTIDQIIWQNHIALAECHCECGSSKTCLLGDIGIGKTQSCGCLQRENASQTGSVYGMENMHGARGYQWAFPKDGRLLQMRSGFEIMYALYLEAQNIKWQYEPKIFILAPGKRYKPDFYLPDTDEWVEIKGVLTEPSREKVEMFRKQGFKITLIFESELKRLSPLSYTQVKKSPQYKLEV